MQEEIYLADWVFIKKVGSSNVVCRDIVTPKIDKAILEKDGMRVRRALRKVSDVSAKTLKMNGELPFVKEIIFKRKIKTLEP